MTTIDFLQPMGLSIANAESCDAHTGSILFDSPITTQVRNNKSFSVNIHSYQDFLKEKPQPLTSQSISTHQSKSVTSIKIKKLFSRKPNQTFITDDEIKASAESKNSATTTSGPSSDLISNAKNEGLDLHHLIENWAGLPPRARPGIQVFARFRSSSLNDYDMDRLRQHRRKVRQARRKMCFFFLYKKSSTELPVGSTTSVTLSEVATTPKILLDMPKNDMQYLNIEGLSTPKKLYNSGAELTLSGRLNTGAYKGPGPSIYSYDTQFRSEDKNHVILPSPSNLFVPNRLIKDSILVLTQMTATLTNHDLDIMQSGLPFHNTIEEITDYEWQISPIHTLQDSVKSVQHKGRTRNLAAVSNSNEYEKINQLHRLPKVGSCIRHEKNKDSNFENSKLFNSAMSTALIKFNAEFEENPSKKVQHRSMTQISSENLAFNERLTTILWYLFKEYMMYPSKSYLAQKSQKQQKLHLSNRHNQLSQEPLTKLRDFARVNYTFCQYLGAIINILVHREWLFNYLGVILSEFPVLVARWRELTENNLLELGNNKRNWLWEKRADEINALRAVRTSCYLICKFFDSKHDEMEIYQFCHGLDDDDDDRNRGKKFFGGIHCRQFISPSVQFKRKSCFDLLLDLSKEEYGMGPTARLTLTYVFSRIQIHPEIMISLRSAREMDPDYFRINRIPLRCFVMVWLKLILLQYDAKIEHENTGTDTLNRSDCYNNYGKNFFEDRSKKNEIKRLADLEVRTVIALEHNTTIRELYFQLFPELNTK